MDLVDRFKQNLALDGGNSSPLVSSEITTSSSTWNTFIESMENARQKASEMFDSSSQPENEAPAGQLATTVKSWWEDASAFLEETRITVEEKISELTGPVEMKNDPLKNLRLMLVSYTNALEQLKAEAFNLSLSAEHMGRMGAQVLGRSLTEPFGDSGTVSEQFVVYKERHAKLVQPALDEVHSGVAQLNQMVADEMAKIESLQTRFKRRDRLHKSLSDMRSRVNIRRDKNNRKTAEGLGVDSAQMEELYELTRTMDSIDSDFRLTSEQLIAKCQEIIGNRSRTFHTLFSKLVDVQNTFFYRIGNTCSIPFQELHEALQADVPPTDDIEEVGSLTWRSESSKQEYMPMKTSPSRRATMSFADERPTGLSGSGSAALKQPVSPPSRYSYARARQQEPTSPIRRAGTSNLLA